MCSCKDKVILPWLPVSKSICIPHFKHCTRQLPDYRYLLLVFFSSEWVWLDQFQVWWLSPSVCLKLLVLLLLGLLLLSVSLVCV